MGANLALVTTSDDGTAITTSQAIAHGTDSQHKNVMELVRQYAADLNEVGRVAFETRPFETAGGTQRRPVAVLDEPAAALLMTYLRNTAMVRDFKKRLVAEFYRLRATQAAPALTDDELIHRALEVSARRVAELSEKVAELEPKAQVADQLLDAEGDLAVKDAAQSLTRAGVKTGGGRLFGDLARRGWIYRAPGDGRWRVKQAAIETGYMSVLPQSHYHPKTGVLVLDPPQPRVTPKGLQRLLVDYGGAE